MSCHDPLCDAGRSGRHTGAPRDARRGRSTWNTAADLAMHLPRTLIAPGRRLTCAGCERRSRADQHWNRHAAVTAAARAQGARSGREGAVPWAITASVRHCRHRSSVIADKRHHTARPDSQDTVPIGSADFRTKLRRRPAAGRGLPDDTFGRSTWNTYPPSRPDCRTPGGATLAPSHPARPGAGAGRVARKTQFRAPIRRGRPEIPARQAPAQHPRLFHVEHSAAAPQPTPSAPPALHRPGRPATRLFHVEHSAHTWSRRPARSGTLQARAGDATPSGPRVPTGANRHPGRTRPARRVTATWSRHRSVAPPDRFPSHSGPRCTYGPWWPTSRSWVAPLTASSRSAGPRLPYDLRIGGDRPASARHRRGLVFHVERSRGAACSSSAGGCDPTGHEAQVTTPTRPACARGASPVALSATPSRPANPADAYAARLAPRDPRDTAARVSPARPPTPATPPALQPRA